MSNTMKPEHLAMFAELNKPVCKIVYAKPKKYRATVEYASDGKRNLIDPGASIAAFYAECRAKYPNLNQVFVGD